MIHSAYITLRDRGLGPLVSAVGNLCSANLQRRFMGRRYVERSVYDYKMVIDLEDPGISRSLLLFGERELDHKVMLERVLKPGMTVFDIGANIGYYVLMQSRLIGAEGAIVAVEPLPSNIEMLKRNLALNGLGDKVEVVHAAVSDRAEILPFHVAKHSNLGTFQTQGSGSEHLTGEVIEINTTTVPELATAHGTPDLLRMDVEGHEVAVINGLLPAVREGSLAPMIVFETHLSRYGPDNDMAATLRALFDCGYRAPLLSSSQASGTERIRALGYDGGPAIRTDGFERVLFENLSNEHVVDLVCRTGGVRTVLLAKD